MQPPARPGPLSYSNRHHSGIRDDEIEAWDIEDARFGRTLNHGNNSIKKFIT
ncbi:hypothetical protein ASZ90_013873 [hydrocarbon metagenome]|uniref:Uncharacterized protein n=1 Tax=hydrocarbon metagenome TaxID=938273 RepID=A0A0W8F6I4_9ZZZZ